MDLSEDQLKTIKVALMGKASADARYRSNLKMAMMN